MLARTDRKRGKMHETYQCRKKRMIGADACAMPIFRREEVEAPALAMFERDALSYEATREHVAEQLQRRIQEARSQAARAGREATETPSRTVCSATTARCVARRRLRDAQGRNRR